MPRKHPIQRIADAAEASAFAVSGGAVPPPLIASGRRLAFIGNPVQHTAWQQSVNEAFMTRVRFQCQTSASDRFLPRQNHLWVLLASIFYYVIGLHAIAAIWHHFVRKDNTLKRML